MMGSTSSSKYLYLDGDKERQQLVQEIHAVRQAVTQIAESLPESEWYTPRYHGWTLAAMLAHLNLLDNLGMMLIKAALVNLRPRLSIQTVNRLNNFTEQIFRKRLVRASLRSIASNEQRISEFILSLPMDKFSKQVYDPALGKFITIEQALQERFWFHWQHHLQTMQQVEGIYPPEQQDKL